MKMMTLTQKKWTVYFKRIKKKIWQTTLVTTSTEVPCLAKSIKTTTLTQKKLTVCFKRIKRMMRRSDAANQSGSF
jgi:hypothetical protein